MNEHTWVRNTQLGFCESDSLYWLAELEMLLSRYSALGIAADVSLMTVCELQGLYRFLVHHKNTMEGPKQPGHAAAAQAAIASLN